MKEIVKFYSRVYLRNGTNAIQIRVLWNNKKNEVDTFIGMYAEPEKWDTQLQMPKRGTTHKVGNNEPSTAREINIAIKEFFGFC